MILSDLIAADGEVPADAGMTEIAGLAADSRAVRPGFLFAALPGTRADGAAFVPAALEAGAAAVLTTREADVEAPANVPVVRAANPRRALARAAARFYGAQPGCIAAVTGTNGKTSVASFLHQLWRAAGHQAASLGTLGVVRGDEREGLGLTSPDPVTLHRLLAQLAGEGVTHLAIEASSHGLAQFRLDGVKLSAGAFTNLSRDHLDYHASPEDYLAAKARLFAELLPKGAPAVLNADAPESEELAGIARARGLEILSVGRAGTFLRLLSQQRDGLGQIVGVESAGRRCELRLPLVGDFQASNALVAAALAIATGAEIGETLGELERLHGACGRLELVARTPRGAPVFVDYAHTPDALENALRALKPHAAKRLAVVFGCGGERDRGKRPQMGAAAGRLADLVYVTDDNPRGEDPAAIRAEIMAAVPGASEIGDRARAIREAIAALGEDDVLLVAGKGHETGQTVGEEVRPFSDQQVVRELLATGEGAA